MQALLSSVPIANCIYFSSFSFQFMGHADLVPFLGTTFIDWFPVVILIPAVTILFNIQGRFLKLCGIPDIYDDDDGEGRHAEDEEGGVRGGRIVLNSEVDEGKALINEGIAHSIGKL
jgi:hypothetical protein